MIWVVIRLKILEKLITNSVALVVLINQLRIPIKYYFLIQQFLIYDSKGGLCLGYYCNFFAF